MLNPYFDSGLVTRQFVEAHAYTYFAPCQPDDDDVFLTASNSGY